MPLPRPSLSHSLATTVFDTEVAVIEDHESDSVLLENRRSTDIPTPGEEVSVLKLCEESTITFHHAGTIISIRTREPPAEVILKFRRGDECLLLIGCHAENCIHEDGLS